MNVDDNQEAGLENSYVDFDVSKKGGDILIGRDKERNGNNQHCHQDCLRKQNGWKHYTK